jgi:hypothetical protein
VIYKPVAHLSHADAGCLARSQRVVSQSTFLTHTLENIAFCSSLGYGFVMFYNLFSNASEIELLGRKYLIKPSLHNLSGLFGQITPFS